MPTVSRETEALQIRQFRNNSHPVNVEQGQLKQQYPICATQSRLDIFTLISERRANQ